MDVYHIEELNSSNARDWEHFNENANVGSFFHSLKWKRIIERSFGIKPHYFLVYEGDDVAAICPFFENNLKYFKGLVSLPYSDFCHVAIENGRACDALIREIYSRCMDTTRQEKLAFLQMSAHTPHIRDMMMRYTDLPPLVSGNMVLHLDELTPDQIWNNIFSAKGGQRKFINRFIREGCTIEEVRDLKDLELFYHYYNENLEQKHVRSFNQTSFFTTIWDIYSPEDMRITLLRKDDFIFGGLFAYLFPPNRTIYLVHLALNRAIPNTYHPPYYLFWDIIEKACEMGYQHISFGGTANNPENPVYRQKSGFGCDYEFKYSLFMPCSPLFRYGYNFYHFMKHGLKLPEIGARL
ncbi:MAG: GNAT family N-acetyltransferase [Methanomicrobiaceae archaeon]|nr:GNAT family N-acetyltransferase [Methanomicrobiaceae archaeon]